jgi:hypothetical protein
MCFGNEYTLGDMCGSAALAPGNGLRASRMGSQNCQTASGHTDNRSKSFGLRVEGRMPQEAPDENCRFTFIDSQVREAIPGMAKAPIEEILVAREKGWLALREE